MIKFFRHIRQNLIMVNKTSKYLKYAIGEIILVVIGILIALQINNWNEARKERIKEVNLLKEINRDFTYNLEELLSLKENHTNAQKACTELQKFINNPNDKVSKSAILNYYFIAFDGGTYNPSNGVVNSLISSGD